MNLARWWFALRTAVMAQALGVAVIGLGQFAFSSVLRPGDCVPTSSPWNRLCYWVESGGKYTLSDFFDRHDLRRLTATMLAVIILSGMFAWSIRAGGPVRLRPFLRVRTLVIAIAVAAIALVEAREVWAMWERWDNS
jgi:hypothetical protein